MKITLLTGYLGSGKTTLINHILTNQNKYKIAVIVNDIGEVNIDASLIEKGGIVTEKDESLVALSNGCICCNLKMDLVKQITDLIDQNKFDYIIIEASGICEPIPIAQTITMIPEIIKNKDYDIQQYNDNSSGYRSHRIPHHPLGSPHPVVLLQGSSEHHPLASESLILDDAIPHTYHPLNPYRHAQSSPHELCSAALYAPCRLRHAGEYAPYPRLQGRS